MKSKLQISWKVVYCSLVAALAIGFAVSCSHPTATREALPQTTEARQKAEPDSEVSKAPSAESISARAPYDADEKRTKDFDARTDDAPASRSTEPSPVVAAPEGGGKADSLSLTPKSSVAREPPGADALKEKKAEMEAGSSDHASAPRSPGSSGVKAGSSDDNLQFNAFLDFLDKNMGSVLPCSVFNRVVISVKDKNGLPLADAKVVVQDGGKTLLERRTYADGRVLIFPSESKDLQGQSVKVVVSYAGKTKDAFLNASGRHQVEIQYDLARRDFQSIPLDVAFIMDTTGSMGDEIAQLKKTLEYIHFQISNLSPRPDVRFGMVLFRDHGDEYVTQLIPLTQDVKEFQAKLNEVQAGGGGDEPEDVQEGLNQTLNELKWREEGVKLAFLIGDAEPHLDYGQTYTYVQAMNDAARKGIKIATIGASGLNTQGETVWRQVAQYTMAPFVFFTH
jgi:Mg-chelatase subunit ChlD